MSFAARALSRRIARAPTRFQARPRTFTTALSEDASTKGLERYLAQDKDLQIHAAGKWCFCRSFSPMVIEFPYRDR